MNWLWQYLAGYLTIEIDAENGERILNKSLQNRIHIWNLRCSNGKITGKISIKNFHKLRHIKRGIKGKIKILNKNGFVFRAKKYKNRLGFIIGIVVFSVIIYTLSNFVWVINIEGNNLISDKDIINSCKEIGIKEGILKKKINNKYDAQRLQLIQKGIAWCSLNTEGSVLTVNLSEAAVSDKEERNVPSNLKSSIEGKIKKIDITSGNTVVKVGDIVSRGDILVSGINQNLTSTLFVHSEGKIIAETKRVFSAEGEYSQIKKLPTGKSIKRYSINFFTLKIPLYLGNIKNENNYNFSVKNLKLFNKKIPIKIATENYELLEKERVNYDKKVLVDLLQENIEKQVKSYNFLTASVCDKDIVYTNKGILLKMTYNCEEDIAVQDKILLNTEN